MNDQLPAGPAIQDDESLDSALGGSVRIIQPKKGYRFSVEAVILACLTNPPRPDAVVFDLGCGAGVVGLCLKSRFPLISLTGIDVQPECVERAARSAELNGWSDTARFNQCDVRDVPKSYKKGLADLVVSNPPFRSPESSRVSPDRSMAISRNEILGALADFTAAAQYLLKSGGQFRAVYPASRVEYLMASFSGAGLSVAELRFLHSREDEEANYVLIAGVKGRTDRVKVVRPLVLHPREGGQTKYTDEVMALIGQPRVYGE